MKDHRMKPRLLTVGRVAEILGKSVSRIEYILRTRVDIEPSAFAGNARLFDRAALTRIRQELDAVESRRGGKGLKPAEASTSLCIRESDQQGSREEAPTA